MNMNSGLIDTEDDNIFMTHLIGTLGTEFATPEEEIIK